MSHTLTQMVRQKVNDYIPSFLKNTVVSCPDSVMIELTNLCNLKCITCPREYNYGKTMNKGMMDFEKFKGVIDEISPYVKSIVLTGLGEILLYKRLSDAVDYIHSKTNNAHIYITTNAHLPDSYFDVLKTISDKINIIQISIDGIGDIYNNIRLKGDYSVFTKNLKTITQTIDCDVMFNMVVFEKNYKQMSDIIKVANDFGVKSIHFNTINLVSISSNDIADYNVYLSKDFIIEYNKAKELANRLKVNFSSFDFESAPGFKKCGFPWGNFYITWDGYLVPCCAKPFPLELNFGNVFNEGFKNCVNSKEFKQFRNLWYRNIAPGFCNKCHILDIPGINTL